MAKALIADQQPRPAEPDDDDVSDAQLERAVKILERREARKLEDARKAAGLRWRLTILKFIGATPGPYPAGACTAGAAHVAERLRCAGEHVTVPREEQIYPGDLIEQPAGHFSDLREYVEVEETQ